MKITYTENPLNTIIELDDHEKEVLFLKVFLRQMEDHLFEIHFYMDETKEYYDMERVKKYADPEYYCDEDDRKCKLRVEAERWFNFLLDSLSDGHCGDCRCVASTCEKCLTEEILGINTIKGLNKHAAHYVFAAFGESNKNNWTCQRNIHEAIEYLENYEPHADWKGWEAHAARWKAEAKDACEWLKMYRDEHFEKKRS